MESFLYYLLRASVLMVLFYGLYRLFFVHYTFHAANRFSLLWMQLMISVLPLFRYNFLPKQELNTENDISSVDFASLSDMPLVNDQSFFAIPWAEILFALFFAGFLFTVVRYLIGLVQIVSIIRTSEKQTLADHTVLCVTEKSVSPFSWMRYVVITRAELSESHEAIIRHEKAHIQLHHSFDMILFDFFTAVFWFNPFSWLLCREMQSLHEYQADEQVLHQGIDTKQYQILLIRKSAGEFKFALANNFRQRDLHKRIKMMKKNKTNRQMRWIYTMVLPALFLGMAVLSAPKLNAKATEAPKDATLPVDSGKVHIQIVGTSLKDNPLVFVDGQKATTEVYNDLQPDEIESISVLKDKQSIEMYGEEGRDGVIIIKTKKNGVDGDEPEVILTDTARGDVKVMIDALNENPPLRLRHSSGNQPIIIVDGKKMTKDFELTTIDSKEIESVTVLKDNKGVELYGEEGKEGVIIITKKK
jgi:TonB-dependent SusC/RagA subfamily outer membrane receptor